MNFRPVCGALALYRGKCALITAADGDKFAIRLAGGDSKNVRRKDLEVIHPGPVSALPAAPPAPPAPDALAETAELLGADALPFAEFTELLFGAFTPAAALGARQLIADDCYFAADGDGAVRANPPEKVRERLEKEELKHERARDREALLERIRTGQLRPDDRPRLREIEQVACGESDSSRLMHDLGMEALPEKAHALLLKLGVWDLFAPDPWPRRFGIDLAPDYPPWPASLPDEPRRDLTCLEAFAIDDADSHDPDDALSVDADGLLWVHIADPGAIVAHGGELARFAVGAAGSLYLPETIVPMLPPAATAMLGLGLRETSPALSFAIAIDADGRAELKDMTLSTIRATRLDYDGAEAMLNREPFRTMLELTGRFRAMRQAAGAVMIQLPEVKIKVDPADRQVVIRPLAMNRVREMVANAMLAAGSAVAQFAAREGLAMPFAVQPEPEMSERPEDLCGMYALRKSCRISTLAALPGRHAGLGLDPYVRVTSPLRRAEDLLAHLQLRRVLKKETPLSFDEIDAELNAIDAQGAILHKLERQANEYWTLVYLAEHPEWRGSAIPVARQDDRTAWLIPELAFEFKNRFNSKLPLGVPRQAALAAVDPAALAVQFRLQ